MIILRFVGNVASVVAMVGELSSSSNVDFSLLSDELDKHCDKKEEWMKKIFTCNQWIWLEKLFVSNFEKKKILFQRSKKTVLTEVDSVVSKSWILVVSIRVGTDDWAWKRHGIIITLREKRRNLPKFCDWKNRALLLRSNCKALARGLLLNGNNEGQVAPWEE